MTLVFSVTGNATELELMHMIARSEDNRNIEIIDNPEEIPTDVEDDVIQVPEISYLDANYPNPFNASTTLSFGVKEAGAVRLSVYNGRGRLVKTLVNDTKAPGQYQIVWDGKDEYNNAVAAGLYLIRMESDGFIQTRKALLIK